jgi:hypothetical protein
LPALWLTILAQSAVISLIIAILNLIRYTWVLAYVATWLLPADAPVEPLSVLIIDPILGYWPMSVLLILLFAIGVRKQKGLWSTQQVAVAPVSAIPSAAQGSWQQGMYVHPQGYMVPPQGHMVPPQGHMIYQQYQPYQQYQQQ